MPLMTSNQGSGPEDAGLPSKNYRYYSQTGVPFLTDSSELVTSAEYEATAVPIGLAGYGLFDVNDPEQKHFGRTLRQVMERVRLSEFEIIRMTEYNNGVVDDDPSKPPALFVFVMWIEKADATPKVLQNYVRSN